MKTDAGLVAVRNARKAISRELDNDPARLVAYYIERQKSFTGILVLGPEAAATDAPPPDEPFQPPKPARSRPERSDGR